MPAWNGVDADEEMKRSIVHHCVLLLGSQIAMRELKYYPLNSHAPTTGFLSGGASSPLEGGSEGWSSNSWVEPYVVEPLDSSE